MKNLIVFFIIMLFSSPCYAATTQKWSLLYEQNQLSFFVDKTTVVKGKQDWKYSFKETSAEHPLYFLGTRHCKINNNKILAKNTEVYGCLSSGCSKLDNEDWVEYEDGTVMYKLCISVIVK